MSNGTRIGVYGRSGSGKSSIMNELIRPADRLIVFDYLPTRRKTASREGLVEITTIKELKKHAKKKKFRVWLRPDIVYQVEALHELSEFCMALQEGAESGGYAPPLTLGIDEMAQCYPNEKIPKSLRGFDRISQAGRHYNINIVGASQRPAKVNPEFRGNCKARFFCALEELPDLKAVGEMIGKPYAQQIARFPDYRYLLWTDGKPQYGWTKQ